MRKIGIFKGIFDPISQRELKELLSEIDPLLIEKLNRKIKAVLG